MKDQLHHKTEKFGFLQNKRSIFFLVSKKKQVFLISDVLEAFLFFESKIKASQLLDLVAVPVVFF